MNLYLLYSTLKIRVIFYINYFSPSNLVPCQIKWLSFIQTYNDSYTLNSQILFCYLVHHVVHIHHCIIIANFNDVQRQNHRYDTSIISSSKRTTPPILLSIWTTASARIAISSASKDVFFPYDYLLFNNLDV